MSRHNKVNKDRYVQRGRLTPDEAARELAKMRQTGSQHRWQPTKKDALPRRESKDPAAGTEATEDKGSTEETPISAETRAASRATAENMAPVKAKAKSSKPKSAKTGNAKQATSKAKTTSAKAKSGSVGKTAAKSPRATPKRKAVLARNVGGLRVRSGQPRAESKGGGGATPRRTAKRRKS